MQCQEFESNASLYLYGELSPDLKAAFEQHRNECPACRAKLQATEKLHALFGAQQSGEVPPNVLADCRRALDAAIDQEAQKLTWRGLMREFLAAFSTAPATRAAGVMTLIVLGFGLGWALRPLLRHGQNTFPASSANELNASDLGGFHINGISQVKPDPSTGGVKITLDAERRVTLQGSLDNPRIRKVLIDAMEGYQNVGIRRDTLDALRHAGNDPGVRSALLYTLQHDPNTGLRLEALQTLENTSWGPGIEKAVIGAVQHDSNPGVRVEAVDLLARHATPAVLPVLDQLASKDPNPYVRFRCTTAVQQLTGNGQ